MSKLLEDVEAMETRMEAMENEIDTHEKNAVFWRNLTNEYVNRMRKVMSILDGDDMKTREKVLVLVKKARSLEKDGDPKSEMKGLLCELEIIL